MTQTEFGRLLKTIEDNGGVKNMFETIKKSDLSDNNKVFVTAFEENRNIKFVWEDRYGEAVQIADLFETGKHGVANEIANSPWAKNNEFVVSNLLKRKLKLACDINIAGMSPNSLYVFECTIEEGEDEGKVYSIMVRLFDDEEAEETE